MSGEVMKWDEDALEYGYVLDRLADGGWWHLHFGRSARSYHCDLLGRRTDILAYVQRFAAGAVAVSPRFILTLDGEGVESAEVEFGLECRWGDRPADPELVDEALHLQREVMPLVYDIAAFQQAAAEVVARQRHRRLVASGKLQSAEPGTAADGGA